jgi:hypothetical protein
LETNSELQEFLRTHTTVGVRGRLLDRGQARAVIRRDGVLPDGAPAFPEGLDTELLEYGLSILRAAMALREQDGDPEVCSQGFLRAAQALEIPASGASS